MLRKYTSSEIEINLLGIQNNIIQKTYAALLSYILQKTGTKGEDRPQKGASPNPMGNLQRYDILIIISLIPFKFFITK